MTAPLAPVAYLPLSEKLLSAVPVLVANSKSKRAVALMLGISTAELNRRLEGDNDPALQDAFAEGESRLEQKLIRTVLAIAEGVESDPRLAFKAATWILERRFPGYSAKPEASNTQQVSIVIAMPRQAKDLAEYVAVNSIEDGGTDD